MAPLKNPRDPLQYESVFRAYPFEYEPLPGRAYAPLAGQVKVPQVCGRNQKTSTRTYSGTYAVEGMWRYKNHVVYKLTRKGRTYYLDNSEAPAAPSWRLYWEGAAGRPGKGSTRKYYCLIVYPAITITQVPPSTN